MRFKANRLQTQATHAPIPRAPIRSLRFANLLHRLPTWTWSAIINHHRHGERDLRLLLLQDAYKTVARDLNISDGAHSFLAFLLALQQLVATRPIAAVQLRGDVLPQRLQIYKLQRIRIYIAST